MFPEDVDAEMSLQENALVPLLFLLGLFGLEGVFTKSCNLYSSWVSRMVPTESITCLSSKTWKRFLSGTGAGAKEWN